MKIRKYTPEFLHKSQDLLETRISTHPNGYFNGQLVASCIQMIDLRGLSKMAGRLGDGEQPVDLQTLVDTYYAELEDLIEYKIRPFIFCHPDSALWTYEAPWSENAIPLSYTRPDDKVAIAKYMFIEDMEDKPVTKEIFAKVMGYHTEREPQRIHSWYLRQEEILASIKDLSELDRIKDVNN
jgi:hypothetical protein